MQEKFLKNFYNTLFKIPEEEYLTNNKIYNKKYKKIRRLGNGTYGKVYLIQDFNTMEFYAMKKFYLTPLKNNSNIISNQIEILNYLQENEERSCYFPKIIDYFEGEFSSKYLIFEYCYMNLFEFTKYINFKENKNVYKSIFYLIIKAVDHLHKNNYIHRDLKPENILITNFGNIKIIDFDLSIKLNNIDEELSKNVGTLYYKPPEIYFGDNKYGFNLDLWSIGCILSEIILGKPLFEEQSEIGVLIKIVDILGIINEENFKGVSQLPTYMSLENNNPKFDFIFEDNLEDDKEFIEIIKKFLQIDPKKRLNCEEILNSSLFNKINEIESRLIISNLLKYN